MNMILETKCEVIFNKDRLVELMRLIKSLFGLEMRFEEAGGIEWDMIESK